MIRTAIQRSTVILVLLALAAPALAQPATDDEPKWTEFLVEITHVERQDPPEHLAAKRRTTARELADAADRERARLTKRLAKIDEEIDRRSGYIVFGWSKRSAGRERAVSSTRSMSGFYVPASTAARRTLGKPEPRAFVVIPRSGSKNLFVAGGRRYYEVKSVRAAKESHAPSAGKAAPPAPAESPHPVDSVDVALGFTKATPSKGATTYRHWLKITASDVPDGATALHLWVRVRLRTVDDEPFGPIPDYLHVPASPNGSYGVTSSFEIRTEPGIELDPDKAAVEVIAVRWAGATGRGG